MTLVYACGLMGWKANPSLGSFLLHLISLDHFILYQKRLISFSLFLQDKVKWTVTGNSYLKFRVDVNGEKYKLAVENKQRTYSQPPLWTSECLKRPLQLWTIFASLCHWLLSLVCDIISVMSGERQLLHRQAPSV